MASKAVPSKLAAHVCQVVDDAPALWEPHVPDGRSPPPRPRPPQRSRATGLNRSILLCTTSVALCARPGGTVADAAYARAIAVCGANSRAKSSRWIRPNIPESGIVPEGASRQKAPALRKCHALRHPPGNLHAQIRARSHDLLRGAHGVIPAQPRLSDDRDAQSRDPDRIGVGCPQIHESRETPAAVSRRSGAHSAASASPASPPGRCASSSSGSAAASPSPSEGSGSRWAPHTPPQPSSPESTPNHPDNVSSRPPPLSPILDESLRTKTRISTLET